MTDLTPEMYDNLAMFAMWHTPGYDRQPEDYLTGPEVRPLMERGLIVQEQTETNGKVLRLTEAGIRAAKGEMA